jgi:ABC-type branched-subunit amino acid transport system ATPase component
MDSDSTIPNDASTATNTENGLHAANGDEDEAIIRAIKLNKFFGDKHVLKDIDFEVRKQEVVALIRPSGSGKSTLIRCLNALEKLTSGEIYIHGKKLNPHLSVKHLSLIRPVNFKTVAETAGISTAWLYGNEALKQRIMHLRLQQVPAVQVKLPQREQASSASKDAVIAALRQRIKKLEEENHMLKQQMEVANGLLYQQG